MTLETLSKDLLLARLVKLVRNERKITHLILECIAEIDRRKLYLEMAYPSLYEFLTQAHGYSAAAAQRRISAARLLREVPDIATKIEDGKLTLSQISLATQNIKIAEKKFATKMDAADKVELLEKIELLSFAETQTRLAQELKIAPPSPEKLQHHADGSVTITMTLTAEQYQVWSQAAELASHAVPNRKSAALAEYLARHEISRRTAIKRVSPRGGTPSKNPRQIAPNLRKRVLANALGRNLNTTENCTSDSELDSQKHKDGCAYTDRRTGRWCGSRFFLQIDHIREVRSGGTNQPQNLRVLCGSHNRWRSQPRVE